MAHLDNNNGIILLSLRRITAGEREPASQSAMLNSQ
jgi:hypothetical protein